MGTHPLLGLGQSTTPHVLSPTALSFLCSAVWIWRLKKPSLHKTAFTGRARGCFLSSVFFSLCISFNRHVYSWDQRATPGSDIICSQKQVVSWGLASTEFMPSSWWGLDDVHASKKYLTSRWHAGLRAGSWDMPLFREGSAILSPQPVLALKLAQHGWVSERVLFLPALSCTSAAQQIRAPEGPTH